MKQYRKIVTLFAFGAVLYYTIECLWRSTWTNPVMTIIGGLCFILMGEINERYTWETPLWMQAGLATIAILVIEFDMGVILNLWIGLNIWDYSHLWGNIYGQICPQFALAWFFLSIVGIMLDDWLRHWWFGEERPRYKII